MAWGHHQGLEGRNPDRCTALEASQGGATSSCVCACVHVHACAVAKLPIAQCSSSHNGSFFRGKPSCRPREAPCLRQAPESMFSVLGAGSRAVRNVVWRGLLRCPGRLAHHSSLLWGPLRGLSRKPQASPGTHVLPCSEQDGGRKPARSAASTPARGQRSAPRLAFSHGFRCSF